MSISIQIPLFHSALTTYPLGISPGIYDVEVMNCLVSNPGGQEFLEFCSNQLFKPYNNQYFLFCSNNQLSHSFTPNQHFKDIQVNNYLDFHLIDKVTGLDLPNFAYCLLDLRFTKK